jgi:hypothetical protein
MRRLAPFRYATTCPAGPSASHIVAHPPHTSISTLPMHQALVSAVLSNVSPRTSQYQCGPLGPRSPATHSGAADIGAAGAARSRSTMVPSATLNES